MASLATPEQFAAFMRRDLTGLTATADLLLAAASEVVVAYCGWHIAPARDEVVTVDGSGAVVQPLPTLHLVALTSVTENGFAVDLGGVGWSQDGVLERYDGGRWTSRRRGLAVGLRHGHDAVPSWLVTLVCAVAGRALVAPIGVTQEAAGGESVSYAQPAPGAGGSVILLDSERRMLDRLALPRAA